jgi:hypothetical protein
MSFPSTYCDDSAIIIFYLENKRYQIKTFFCLNNKIAPFILFLVICISFFSSSFSFLPNNYMIGRQHYRLYTIQSIPSLKVLDHQRITQTERDRARRLAGSAAGAALESDIQVEAGKQKTFTPGEGESAEESFAVNFTPEEKEQIRQMVANAESPTEIEEIERSVQRGILPKPKTKKGSDAEAAAANEGKEGNNSTDLNNGNDRKRPPPPPNTEENNNGEGGHTEKKIKT